MDTFDTGAHSPSRQESSKKKKCVRYNIPINRRREKIQSEYIVKYSTDPEASVHERVCVVLHSL